MGHSWKRTEARGVLIPVPMFLEKRLRGYNPGRSICAGTWEKTGIPVEASDKE